MSQPPIDMQRVDKLLQTLRHRTPDEIALGVMALAGCLSPEMWHALKLLKVENAANE